MTQYKQRYYVAPSSLASYFGQGFNSPEEQFKLDTGQTPTEFDDESIRRMVLGEHLEDSVINYFQDIVFKVPITDRNDELKSGYDGKVMYKIDGIIHLDEPAIFEAKVSNSKGYKFTEHMGYNIQCQTYMLCEGLNKTILAGLYQGRPIYRVIERDEELISDIKRMIDFVVDALQGLVDFYDDYPVDLLDKYSSEVLYEPIEELSSITLDYLYKLAELEHERRKLDNEIKRLKAMHEDDLDITEGVYEDDVIHYKVSYYTRKGGFDLDLFKEENPYFDLTKYYLPDTKYSRKMLKLKEPL